MDTSYMTQTDCLGLAQCLRNSILCLARGEFANHYRVPNYRPRSRRPLQLHRSNAKKMEK